MDNNEFPPNSRKVTKPVQAEEPKKVEKIVTGEVVQRKKSLGARFKETFVGGDARSVAGYVVLEVLVPAAKDMAADAVQQGLEKLLFGEIRSAGRRPRTGTSTGYTSYNRFSQPSVTPRDGHRVDPREAISKRGRATFDFDEIVLQTRAEAEAVIDSLFQLVSQYEVASVSDLYNLVGITTTFTDNKWGWTDLRGAGATRISTGYLLDLPRPEPIDG